MSTDDIDAETVAEAIKQDDELQEQLIDRAIAEMDVDESMPEGAAVKQSRRETLKQIGAVAGGGLLGALGTTAATREAQAADTSVGQLGSSGSPVDVALDQIKDDGGDVVADIDDTGDVDFKRGVATPAVTTGDVNRERSVPQFGTIQEAHDDLPDTGGVVTVTEAISETGIRITKPITLRGVNQGFVPHITADRPAVIDTSGGDGILIKDTSARVHNLIIQGDRTGGYGLRAKQQLHGIDVDGVVVRSKGGTGFEMFGACVDGRLNAKVYDCGSHGWHFRVPDGLGQNNMRVAGLWTKENDGDGVRIEQLDPSSNGVTNFIGNLFLKVNVDGNGGRGINHINTPSRDRYVGNRWVGYGCENNSGDDIREAGKWNVYQFGRDVALDIDYYGNYWMEYHQGSERFYSYNRTSGFAHESKVEAIPYYRDIVGLWPLDNEPTDYSFVGGDLSFAGSPGYADGRTQEGLSLNGSDQYATIPANSEFQIVDGDTNFFIAMWLIPDELSGDQVPISFGNQSQVYLNINGNGTVGLFYRINNTTYSAVAPGACEVGVPTHIVAQYDPSTGAEIYADGEFADRLTLTGTFDTRSNDDEIGRLHTGDRYYNGVVDEVIVSGGNMPAPSIWQLYQRETVRLNKP